MPSPVLCVPRKWQSEVYSAVMVQLWEPSPTRCQGFTLAVSLLPQLAIISVLLSQVIHDFLFSLKESPEKFQIEANFPRRVLPCLPTEEWPNPPTLQEAGLSHTEVLFVQDLTDD